MPRPQPRSSYHVKTNWGPLVDLKVVGLPLETYSMKNTGISLSTRATLNSANGPNIYRNENKEKAHSYLPGTLIQNRKITDWGKVGSAPQFNFLHPTLLS